MVKRSEIAAAAERELRQLFPGLEAVYHDLVPTQFTRPSAMIALSGETMALRTLRTVARSVDLTLLLFCPVDAYHKADRQVMSAMADCTMEHFSAPGLPVDGRVLDIGTIKVVVGTDYAELTIPLSWDDDRRAQEDTAQLLERVQLRIQTT